MDISAIGKMLGMARGHERLERETAQCREGSGGCGSQLDEDQIKQMFTGRKGLEAMLPDSDNGRKVDA
ncbi:hypothetical protein [Pseudomonas spelaei]|jgi:hypothetical protein